MSRQHQSATIQETQTPLVQGLAVRQVFLYSDVKGSLSSAIFDSLGSIPPPSEASGGVGMTCLVSGGPCFRGGQRLGLQLHLGARLHGLSAVSNSGFPLDHSSFRFLFCCMANEGFPLLRCFFGLAVFCP